MQLDTQGFLARHWQREHLLIPEGFRDFEPPADANELAGLAMEPDADSRIVTCDTGVWREERGPFTHETFARSGPWSLLVHGVDHYWDEAAELLQSVDFLPRWRLDNVLMSYASDGGTAGAHFDNYDVFIVQGEGQRRWQVGDFCDHETPLLANCDMRLLASFTPRAEYLLRTGDVLYIPPGQAHFGISEGESTSFSIGFRAPRLSDLLARWTDNTLATLRDDQLLRDPARPPATRSGEISSADQQTARRQLQALFDQSDLRWFGEALTEPHDDTAQESPGNALSHESDLPWVACRPGRRLAWSELDDGSLLVFSHGASRPAPAALREALETLCTGVPLARAAIANAHPTGATMLDWLHEGGTIESHD